MIFFFLSPSSFIPPYLRRISPYILFPRTWHHSVPIFLFCRSSKRLGSSNQILASKSTANEFIYIYIHTRIGRRVYNTKKRTHVDTEKEGGKLVGRWSPINLVIPNWECKIHAVRICASVRRDLSVRRSRWAGTASNLFVCFMDSGPDSARPPS